MFPSDAVRHGSGTAAAKLSAVVVFVAALVVAPATWRAPVAVAATPTAFTDVPTNVDAADGTALEPGVKWRSAQDGYARGVRFHKGEGNTGTHTGSLDLVGGQGSLYRSSARGTFTDETETG